MTNTYTTISGDEWDGICYKVYGADGEMHMDKAMHANPSHISTAVFPANVVLNMPEISVEQQSSKDLPPWLR